MWSFALAAEPLGVFCLIGFGIVLFVRISRLKKRRLYDGKRMLEKLSIDTHRSIHRPNVYDAH